MRSGSVQMSMPKDSCAPCLSEKQIKKNKEAEVKEIKNTVNYLIKYCGGYDDKTMHIVGCLICRMINLTGPLK